MIKKKPAKKKSKNPLHERISSEVQKVLPDAEIDFTSQGETHLMATCGLKKVCFATKDNNTVVLFRMAHPKPDNIQSTYSPDDPESFESLISKASRYLSPAEPAS